MKIVISSTAKVETATNYVAFAKRRPSAEYTAAYRKYSELHDKWNSLHDLTGDRAEPLPGKQKEIRKVNKEIEKAEQLMKDIAQKDRAHWDSMSEKKNSRANKKFSNLRKKRREMGR